MDEAATYDIFHCCILDTSSEAVRYLELEQIHLETASMNSSTRVCHQNRSEFCEQQALQDSPSTLRDNMYLGESLNTKLLLFLEPTESQEQVRLRRCKRKPKKARDERPLEVRPKQQRHRQSTCRAAAKTILDKIEKQRDCEVLPKM